MVHERRAGLAFLRPVFAKRAGAVPAADTSHDRPKRPQFATECRDGGTVASKARVPGPSRGAREPGDLGARGFETTLWKICWRAGRAKRRVRSFRGSRAQRDTYLIWQSWRAWGCARRRCSGGQRACSRFLSVGVPHEEEAGRFCRPALRGGGRRSGCDGPRRERKEEGRGTKRPRKR